MKLWKLTVPVLAVTVLAGCSAYEVEQVHKTAPAVEQVSSNPRADWADKKITEWLGANSARSVKALNAPASFVDSWESPEDGVLIVRTDGGAYSKPELGMVASSILHGTGEDVRKITVVNGHGKIEATIERP